MKFYGLPNMAVYEINPKHKHDMNIYKRKRLVFRFDERGEFVTDDETLIPRLVKKFRCEETNTTLPAKPIEAEEVEIRTENTLRHCKKCDFVCATQGELLRHYRENHPKEDK